MPNDAFGGLDFGDGEFGGDFTPQVTLPEDAIGGFDFGEIEFGGKGAITLSLQENVSLVDEDVDLFKALVMERFRAFYTLGISGFGTSQYCPIEIVPDED